MLTGQGLDHKALSGPSKNVIKDDVDKMRNRFRSVLITFLLLATVLFVTACSNEDNPYEANNNAGYTFSVRYDANGGMFTTNTAEIVDSYNLSELPVNASGKVEVALIAPDNTLRGQTEAFNASKAGYFLAGWYTSRTENGTDSNGNVIYTYSGRWDFDNDTLEVDPNGTYSADEPYVTLYAAWVPLFEIHFMDLKTNEEVGVYTYNPMNVTEVKVPQWNPETGAVDMYKFKERKGFTFNGAYYDAEATRAATELVEHPGTLDLATGTADVTSMNVYIDYMEGEWYHIYTAEQLKNNANPSGNYVLCADLDFTDVIWPSLFSAGAFNGTIEGNGYTISNVSIITSRSQANAGLFGVVAEGAAIRDVTFENITLTLKVQVMNGTPAYGLLAGNVSGNVFSNVTVTNGTLQIDSDCYFGVQYMIGLVCGSGSTNGVSYDLDNLAVSATGDKAESVVISIDGETVTFEIG